MWLTAAPAALAAVTVTFYGHEGLKVRGGFLYFPHAYVRMTGTLDATGEPISQAVGFTARSPGPHLLFGSGPGLLAEPDARYLDEGIGYAAVTVSDETYARLQARIAEWRADAAYNLRRRNCIHFVADLAALAGLQAPPTDTLSPNGWMKDLQRLNPAAALVAPAPQPPSAPAAG